MNDDERAAIYAAMQDDDDDSDSEITPITNDTSVFTKTIEINGQKHVLPSLEYVRRLEATVNAQARVLQKMERHINRVSALMRHHRSSINNHSNRLSDHTRELEQKIDRRD